MNKLLSEDINRIKFLIEGRNILNESSTKMAAPVPIPKKINHPFGEKRSYEIHPGVDLGVPSGTEVKSPMDGIVKLASMNQNPKCGGTIDIDYGNGFWSRFCHIKRIDVKKGDFVKQGQTVGLSGGGRNDEGRGNSKGAHLHWTLKKDGKLVDPMVYVDKSVDPSKLNNLNWVDNILNFKIGDKSLRDILGPDFISKVQKNFTNLS